LHNIQLIVGTGSTWSIRAWLCLMLAKIEFSERIIQLENPAAKQTLSEASPTGLVPVLQLGTIDIHDSLAIAEYANEQSNGSLYPHHAHERAIARSYCAELHSGFLQLRQLCPFTFNKQTTPVMSNELQREVNRLNAIFSSAQGTFFFEQATVVDAFYAVLAYRVECYGIELSTEAALYQKALLSWPLFQKALNHARQWGE